MIPLLSAGRGSALQTSTTSIGMLHNGPFNFVTIKTFNFKFKNFSFTKLPEKILIRHVIY